MQLIIPPPQWEAMRAHVESQAPLEACGLLAGSAGAVEIVLPIANLAGSPVRFRMDPQEQLKAFEQIETLEMDLLGIFHSHPSGPDLVSATDIEEAAYPVIQIVWSPHRGGWRARGFWIEHGKAAEVELRLTEKK